MLLNIYCVHCIWKKGIYPPDSIFGGVHLPFLKLLYRWGIGGCKIPIFGGIPLPNPTQKIELFLRLNNTP